MSVDMYEYRFRKELNKLPSFVMPKDRDQAVWDVGFPAWRGFFTSLCLYGHSTGYRLFSFEEFFKYVKNGLCQKHKDAQKYRRYFEGKFLPGMMERAAVWYESGMAETYLYVCLVEAIEDRCKNGIVLYDPRVDWKLKEDVFVLLSGRPAIVSAYFGDEQSRPGVESRREEVERERKINTSESAQWGNLQLASLPRYEITRDETDCQVVNGVRLYSIASINRLLATLYDSAGVQSGYYFGRSTGTLVMPSSP